MLDVSPRLRDTLSRGFWIEEEIAHVPHSRDAPTRAKVANPTTLLTCFAEELPPSPRLRRTCRRTPEAGPDAGRGRRVVLKLEA